MSATHSIICKKITLAKICKHPKVCIADEIDASFLAMLGIPHTDEYDHKLWFVVTFGRLCHGHDWKRCIIFFYQGIKKITSNLVMLSNQILETGSQLLIKFKLQQQGHCNHWVTPPHYFATHSNHCDVRAGLLWIHLLKHVIEYDTWGITTKRHWKCTVNIV